MEMHQLRYVAAVARTGNFSRAAEQCHVSQPSLSQQVQKLEGELGERLFERTRRGVRLTPAGEAFLPRALRVLEEVNSALREAREAGELLRGTLRVGVLPTIAPYLLPGVIAAFAQKFPGVEIVVQEDTTAQLLRAAAVYEIDLALASLPLLDDHFAIEPLFTEELLLALPAGHRLATKRRIAAADLEGERLIVMKEGHCLGDQVLAFCDRQAAAAVRFRSAQLETIHALVRAGLGISLVPAMAARSDTPGLLCRSLQAPRPERTIVACWPKSRVPSRAAEAFLAELRA
jgi:LysR family hydrogen peroxide-inducible transcriptional activator